MFFTDHKECDYYKRTPGRKLSLVRHPFPDKSRERFHYCHVNDPSVNERAVGDFQPCAQLRKLFNPFAPGDFAEKRVLKLVEWFSGHCRAIKS